MVNFELISSIVLMALVEMISIRLISHISVFVFSQKINEIVIPFILVSDGRNERKISRLRWWTSLYAHERSVESAITMSNMIFHFGDIKEMFEQVGCFVLIYVASLKYGDIVFFDVTMNTMKIKILER